MELIKILFYVNFQNMMITFIYQQFQMFIIHLFFIVNY